MERTANDPLKYGTNMHHFYAIELFFLQNFKKSSSKRNLCFRFFFSYLLPNTKNYKTSSIGMQWVHILITTIVISEPG